MRETLNPPTSPSPFPPPLYRSENPHPPPLAVASLLPETTTQIQMQSQIQQQQANNEEEAVNCGNYRFPSPLYKSETPTQMNGQSLDVSSEVPLKSITIREHHNLSGSNSSCNLFSENVNGEVPISAERKRSSTPTTPSRPTTTEAFCPSTMRSVSVPFQSDSISIFVSTKLCNIDEIGRATSNMKAVDETVQRIGELEKPSLDEIEQLREKLEKETQSYRSLVLFDNSNRLVVCAHKLFVEMPRTGFELLTALVDGESAMGRHMEFIAISWPYDRGKPKLVMSDRSKLTSYVDITEAGFDSSGVFSLYDATNARVWSISSKDFKDPSILLRRLRIDPDGNLRIYSWDSTLHLWKISWQAIDNQCDVFGSCGLYSLCGLNSTGPVCSCLYEHSLGQNSGAPGTDSGFSGCKKLVDVGNDLIFVFDPGISTLVSMLGVATSVCFRCCFAML